MEAEELDVLSSEYTWLLTDEFPSVLKQLTNIIQICNKKFQNGTGAPGINPVSKGSNFLLSLPNSDAVKGLINIAGDSVIKAEMRFKFPKLQNDNQGCFIFEQCPWKLQQLQDANNHLCMALEEIVDHESFGNFTSAKQVLQLMDNIMHSLSRAKTCLIVPEKLTLNELMAINAQKVLNPPVAEELLISFHINCDKLVLLVYVHNIMTTAPSSLKNMQQDSHAIGHVYEFNGRSMALTIIRTELLRQRLETYFFPADRQILEEIYYAC